jgi:hypothetical protein
MKEATSTGSSIRLADLIACLVLGTLVLGLLLCGIRKAQAADEDKRCMNNLKQLLLAVHNYAATFPGNPLPPLYQAPVSNGHNHPQTLFFTLLPDLEQDNLYKAGMTGNGKKSLDPDDENVDLTWMGVAKGSEIYKAGLVPTFVCPADPTNSTTKPTKIGWAGCSYGANYTVFGAKDWHPIYNLGNIPDGTSNTIFLAERFAQYTGTSGEYTGPDGKKHQANTLWAWPPAYKTKPPTEFTKPVPQNAPMFAYGDPDKKEVGYGKVVFSKPQIDVTPDKADYRLVQSGHPKVVHVAMGDGSARPVDGKVSQETWQHAITPADGVPFGSDW